MKLEIKVVSTDIIPPSSPTPNDVSNYKFSFPDQLTVPVHMPHTFFYESTGSLNNSEISSHLKKSLSKTLSLYYPLAGRIVDNTHVNCNDEGVVYVEALADCNLLDVIKKPIPHELDKLSPRNVDDVRDVCVIVQTTFFKCGGLAIGISFSHKLGDAWSSFLFFNCWAAISRGDEAHIQAPVFDGATLFPPISDLGGFDPKRWFTNEERITRRFVFTASKINELRDKYTNTTRATRIEALSTFIWSRFLVCAEAKADPKRSFIQLHAVNIRKRAVPPFPDELSGNLIQHVVPSLGENEEGVLENMTVAIRSIDGDYVTKLREGTQTLDSLNDFMNKVLSGEVVLFTFSSICRFPVYEVDFGWGKPVWFGLGSSHQTNIAIFLDSFSQGDIEAWITLKSEDMAKFEADEEFLAYAAT